MNYKGKKLLIPTFIINITILDDLSFIKSTDFDHCFLTAKHPHQGTVLKL